MDRTLRYGSIGADVTKLQTGLNLLPSNLARLKTDGIYGAKTTSRVKEFQSSAGLVPDGITGALTWEAFGRLLAAISGVPVMSSAYDMLRPAALMIAQQYLGAVDFLQLIGGRPRGLDFLIHMFQLATGRTLTDENFKNPQTKAWRQQPWIDSPTEKTKSWCGIFCVYCYKRAGINVSWDFTNGKPVPKSRIEANQWSPQFVAKMRQGDIGVVSSNSHHFLIEEIGGGKAPSMTTLDGNQKAGRILRIWPTQIEAHRVLVDNFSYYSLKG